MKLGNILAYGERTPFDLIFTCSFQKKPITFSPILRDKVAETPLPEKRFQCDP
jgi:hypothetical protein